MPRAYIFDLDGTRCDIDHRLHHINPEPRADGTMPVKDWDAFYRACPKDAPVAAICHLAHSLIQREFILFVTGRDEMVRPETLKWLRQFVAPPGLISARSKLYMRASGDHRQDHVIKGEMLTAIRADGFDVIMAFEDRASVVKMWREAGIVCAQVAEGDF